MTALAAAAILLLALVIWIACGNKALELNSYTLKNENLPDSFNGFRIAQVSDLHNAKIGKDNEKLISMLKDTAQNQGLFPKYDAEIYNLHYTKGKTNMAVNRGVGNSIIPFV